MESKQSLALSVRNGVAVIPRTYSGLMMVCRWTIELAASCWDSSTTISTVYLSRFSRHAGSFSNMLMKWIFGTWIAFSSFSSIAWVRRLRRMATQMTMSGFSLLASSSLSMRHARSAMEVLPDPVGDSIMTLLYGSLSTPRMSW